MNDLELLYLISKIRIIDIKDEKETIKKRLGILNAKIRKENKHRENIELCIQKLGSDRMYEFKEIIEKAEHKYKIK